MYPATGDGYGDGHGHGCAASPVPTGRMRQPGCPKWFISDLHACHGVQAVAVPYVQSWLLQLMLTCCCCQQIQYGYLPMQRSDFRAALTMCIPR